MCFLHQSQFTIPWQTATNISGYITFCNFRDCDNLIAFILINIVTNNTSILVHLGWLGCGLYSPRVWQQFLGYYSCTGPFLGKRQSQGCRGVVTDHQCLPTLCGEGTLPLEGSGNLWVKDTNKSLQMMHRNTANMKNTQLIHIHRLKLMD